MKRIMFLHVFVCAVLSVAGLLAAAILGVFAALATDLGMVWPAALLVSSGFSAAGWALYRWYG